MSVNGTAPQSEPQESAAVQATPASSSPTTLTPASPAESEQAPPRDWFRDAFASTRTTYDPSRTPSELISTETPPASVQPTETEKPPEQTPAPATERQSRESPQPARSFTQEDFDKAVQAETDRRTAKWQREEGERRRRAALEEQQRQDRELRDKDPYAYAERVKQREQENAQLQQQLIQTHELLMGSVRDYDSMVLDPIMAAVPVDEQKKILESIEDGLPGRGQAANKALKFLEKHWTQKGIEQARQRLMQDPVFVKEVLARHGGQKPEPEHVPAVAGPGPAGGRDMNSLLRQMNGRSR